MNCPVCSVTLQMAERSGVEIDYCPQCRGIWLDRGELDRILERSACAPVQDPRLAPERTVRHHDDDDDDDHHDGRRGLFGGRQHGRREGFLSDLFDG